MEGNPLSKVFIPQVPRFRNPDSTEHEFIPKLDLSPAKNYGELVECVSSAASPHDTDEVIEVLNEVLYNYSDDDYLLCVGSPIIIGWATAIAASYNEGKLNMLVWDKFRGGYKVVKAHLWSNE